MPNPLSGKDTLALTFGKMWRCVPLLLNSCEDMGLQAHQLNVVVDMGAYMADGAKPQHAP